MLATTTDPVLRAEFDLLRRGISCHSLRDLPVISEKLHIPKLHMDPAGWRKASSIFRAFEDAVSQLAGAQFVADDQYHGVCLLELLAHWADESAFLQFTDPKDELQVWFQTESSLFAAAFAYSIVRDEVPSMSAEKIRIETWLNRAAWLHLSYAGGADGSCCNNHYYRRAVYAAMIGVLTEDNDLFRIGVAALYSALTSANDVGALGPEMSRGSFAVHYQNYATMYLVYLAQIVSRQGYDLYGVSDHGHDLNQIIAFTLHTLDRPDAVIPFAGPKKQDMDFLDDGQYFSWLELLPAGSDNAVHAKALRDFHRPIYNRSLGGFATLYFAEPALP